MVRGRRRLASAFLTIGVAVALTACTQPGQVTAPAPTGTRATVSTAIHRVGHVGTVVRSVTVAPAVAAANIAAAGDAALYVAVSDDSDDGSKWTIDRIDAGTGEVTSRSLTLPFLRTLVVGPDGLYVTTSVIEKYGPKPDTILRLDPTSLATSASRRLDTGALWDGTVSVVASNGRLVEADGGGAVRLLDPRTLATLATRHLITSRSDLAAADDVEDPVIAGGRVWVYSKQHFLSLSLRSLATVASTSSRGYAGVLSTPDGLIVVGQRFGHLAEDGTISPTPVVAGVDTTDSPERVGVTDVGVVEQPVAQTPRVVLRSWTGGVLASEDLDAANGSLLAASGRNVWLTGERSHPDAVTLLRVQ